MPPRLTLFIRALLCVFAVFGCRSRQATVQKEPAPATTASATKSEIQPDALYSALASAARLAPSTAPAVDATKRRRPLQVAAVSDKIKVYCATRACQAGTETCCRTADEGVCVASVKPEPADEARPLGSQIDACNAQKLAFVVDTIARCDESIDCGEAEICCAQLLYGGLEANLCVPLGKDGPVCDWHELCVDGGACRTTEAICANGACQKAVQSVPCGDITCTEPKNVCCLESMRCGLATDCPSGALRCSRRNDCLNGQFCEVSFLGTQCTGQVAWGAASIACDTDDDCRGLAQCKRARCEPSNFPRIGRCECGAKGSPPP